MRFARSLALGLVIVAGVSGCGQRQQEADVPDLAGIWLPDAYGAEPWPAQLPLTPVAREAMARFVPAEHDPTTFCMPLGTPRNMLQTGYPIEIVQTPQRIVIVVQPNLANTEVRRIPLGSPLPDSPDPSWYGTSRGRWEGSTLVVETIGLRPDAPIGGHGLTHSAELRVVERFSVTRNDQGQRVLVDEIELHDPHAYETPLKTRRQFVSAPQALLREPGCVEMQWIDKLWRDRLREHAEAARPGRSR
jgi:hypothetical protein